LKHEFNLTVEVVEAVVVVVVEVEDNGGIDEGDMLMKTERKVNIT